MTMTTWNETTPLGSSALSGGDDTIRELKTATRERFELEHTMTSSGTASAYEGMHKLASGVRSAVPTPDVAGRVYVSTDLKMVSVSSGASAWINLPFDAGTKMMFNQAAAPTGWTRDTDVDDKTILITAAGTGGATGGAWAISGLTTANESSHTHTFSGTSGSPDTGINVSSGGYVAASSYHTHTISGTTGAGSAHSHTATGDGNWRPAYQYVIKATKD